MKILDIGPCDFVFNTLLDKSFTINYEYHTLDITSKDKRENWIHEHIHDCNTPGYPFADKYFDLIICSDVIEHVRNQDVLINEIIRVLKDNGEIFLTTPNYSSPPYIRNILSGKMFHNPLGNEFSRYCFNDHVRYYTTKDLI